MDEKLSEENGHILPPDEEHWAAILEDAEQNGENIVICPKCSYRFRIDSCECSIKEENHGED